jgi:hypothetical protein
MDSLIFLAGLAAHPWGLLRLMSPPVRTLGWGWGVYGPPTLGTTRDLVHVPASLRSPICKCRAYSGPLPAARSRATTPPVRTPQRGYRIKPTNNQGPTAEGGHAPCQAQLASPRIQQSHPAGPQPRVSDQPPVARESCVQREADQGWVGVSCTS